MHMLLAEANPTLIVYEIGSDDCHSYIGLPNYLINLHIILCKNNNLD